MCDVVMGNPSFIIYNDIMSISSHHIVQYVVTTRCIKVLKFKCYTLMAEFIPIVASVTSCISQTLTKIPSNNKQTTTTNSLSYTLLLDTDNVFEEFVITENFLLLQDLYDMPESLFMFRPFVLQ